MDRTNDFWPYSGLDVRAARTSGWTPTPFRQFVVKLHSRCNLACTYCYVYTMGDSTWRDAPRVMSPETVATVAARIAEHVVTHRLDSVDVVFHGGEPLLAGAGALDAAATAIRSAVPATCAVGLSVQTNGVLLDEAVLAVLHRHGIRVGISLDGPPEVNDRRRVFADGRGSFAPVARALAVLGEDRNAHLFAGILCTIDVRHDPLRTYDALVAFRPPVIDFLLPHGNWTRPPVSRNPDPTAAPYGEWLSTIYDQWHPAPPTGTRVRLFESILAGVLGGHSASESVGLAPVGMVVVDTGGQLEQVDSLRSVHHDAASVGLDVFDHSFDDALDHPGVIARQIGAAALPETCTRCPVVSVCGGGFYPHRWREGSGYRNPSVYCADLQRLIRHIGRRVTEDLRALSGPPR